MSNTNEKKLFGKLGVLSAKKVFSTISSTKAKVSQTIAIGIVNAGVLNIRSAAGTNGKVLGRLTRGNYISILEKTSNNWYKFKYNNVDAFVFGKFVVYLKGRINAGVLNVRDKPETNSKILYKLRRNDIVVIAQKLKNWYKIRYKNDFAFVFAKYVELYTDSDKNDDKKGGSKQFLKDKSSLLNVAVEPRKIIKVPSTPRENKIVALTYNRYGNLLKKLCNEIKIDIATAIAVLAVESGGNGFGKSGKVIIRFENHLFDSFWGKQNRKTYDAHFRYSKSKRWSGHLFRKDKSSKWTSFHGNQEKEWEVFRFAQKLNEKAALFSASYGAPQILGTNYKVVGYKDTRALLDNFSKDIRYHIFALFDFFNPAMVKHLQRKEFRSFARYYNGKGQEYRYGNYIKTHYTAFKKLS